MESTASLCILDRGWSARFRRAHAGRPVRTHDALGTQSGLIFGMVAWVFSTKNAANFACANGMAALPRWCDARHRHYPVTEMTKPPRLCQCWQPALRRW